jgi:hypothetical protein
MVADFMLLNVAIHRYIEKMVATIIGLSVSVLGLIVALVVGQCWGPVSRGQLTRFARRQRLTITPGNGEAVIRYLAHTRRWRGAGVIIGACASVAISFEDDAVGITGWMLLAGWFAGAIIAEVRLARGPAGPRRVASLQPRTHQAYVGVLTWYAVPAALLGSAVTVIISGRRLDQIPLVLAATVVVTATLIIRARILHRAQPHLPDDAAAADDAIRSRSLHALCGGAVALATQAIGVQCIIAGNSQLAFVFAYGGALLGWSVGTATFDTRRRRPATVVAA